MYWILDRNNITEINKLRTYFLILTIVKILLTCRMNYTQHSHPKSCHLEFCFKYPDLASSARSHLPGIFQWYLWRHLLHSRGKPVWFMRTFFVSTNFLKTEFTILCFYYNIAFLKSMPTRRVYFRVFWNSFVYLCVFCVKILDKFLCLWLYYL